MLMQPLSVVVRVPALKPSEVGEMDGIFKQRVTVIWSTYEARPDKIHTYTHGLKTVWWLNRLVRILCARLYSRSHKHML